MSNAVSPIGIEIILGSPDGVIYPSPSGTVPEPLVIVTLSSVDKVGEGIVDSVS